MILPFHVTGTGGNRKFEAKKTISLPDIGMRFSVVVYFADTKFSANTAPLVWDERDGLLLRFDETVVKFEGTSFDPSPARMLIEELQHPGDGWSVHPLN